MVKQDALAKLKTRFGDRYSDATAIRAQHCHTVNWVAPEPPDAVIFPHTTEEVQEIVVICRDHQVPVIPFGAGTSLEGHVNAPLGGVCISTREMNKILAINDADLDVVVQPGITREDLNRELRATGLFFPIDPGANATLGGMASTRASGTNAVRYGTMKNAVLGLTVVLADGSVMRTGGGFRKSAAGYDMTALFVGAEGTLGVITEIRMRLAGIPGAVSGGVCGFPTLEAACNAVILTIQCGIPVARIELLDEMQVRACNRYSGLTLTEQPTLFLEFHGTESSVAEQAEQFREIAQDLGGGPFEWTTDPDRRARLWKARHDAHWANLALIPGARNMTTDVCVPISRLADCIAQTQADLVATGLTATIVGHVGDGNFHVLPLFAPDDAEARATIKGFVGRLIERALAMGGTCTGEHGIGQEKRAYLAVEAGPVAMNAMAAIKMALDPQGLMNPGKIITDYHHGR